MKQPLPTLVEYEPCRFPSDLLTQQEGQRLWLEYGALLDVSFPSPRTDWQWELKSRGVVGHIPIGDGDVLRIRPRVPIKAIFKMWEIAYDIEPRLFPPMVGVESLEDFYSWLASQLAKQALARLRRGLYREYLEETERLPYVRGRLDVRRMIEHPWQVDLDCAFQEHTADIEDNRLILAALRVAAESTACSQVAVRPVRHAYWQLQQSAVRAELVLASRCLGRDYNRLNVDYRPMHTISHFLLSHTGPSEPSGESRVRAFVVSMPKLFETFVARWLRRRLPAAFRIDAQRSIAFGPDVNFVPDVVVRRRSDGTAVLVVDTKYKISATPAEADVAQVVAYATGLQCTQAVLLYPMVDHRPVEGQVGSVRVRTLAFPLDADLDVSGVALLEKMLPAMAN